jgi:hypothetical protein
VLSSMPPTPPPKPLHAGMTYPLDLLRTRLAAQAEPRVYLGLSHAVVSVVRQEGTLQLLYY